MVRYVIVKKSSTAKPSPGNGGVDAVWSVLELPSKKEVGSLRRLGEMFTAETSNRRNSSEAAKGLLVLRITFRSDHFFIERDGQLEQLREIDLL